MSVTKKRCSKSPLVIVVFFLVLSASRISVIHALDVTVRIPEKYTNIVAGERIYFEIDLKYPENRTRKDLRMEYEITNQGETVAQAKVLKAIETQSAFTDFLVIPESAENGLYKLNIKILDYENLNEESFTTFSVTEKGNELRIYFVILLSAISIFGLVVIWEIKKIRYTALSRM